MKNISDHRPSGVASIESKGKSHQRRLNILVVEERTGTAASLTASLHAEGHLVHVAADWYSSPETARVLSPDLILLDFGQPRLDGYAVAKRLHDQFSWRRPFLIAITDDTGSEACRCAQEAGIDLHLIKPVELQNLLPFLRRFGAMLEDIEGFDPGL